MGLAWTFVGYSSGYNLFNIVDILGVVLVVDNDAVLLDRISKEKDYHEVDASIPASAFDLELPPDVVTLY